MNDLIISADDYGQNEAINQGILSLIEQGRVSAMSCLTGCQNWPKAARLITREIRAKADIGLHLDFTDYAQPVRHRLAVLIAKSLIRSLSPRQIRATINAQLDLFEEILGTPPDYVDGHQHVHQFPQIRNELIDILLGQYPLKPWIRISDPTATAGIKGKIISSLGARQMAYMAAESGFRHSGKLLGVYDFDVVLEAYFSKLEGWLASAQNPNNGTAVLMCHPAFEGNCEPDLKDSIRSARLLEFQALASPRFDEMLEKYRIRIVRGKPGY